MGTRLRASPKVEATPRQDPERQLRVALEDSWSDYLRHRLAFRRKQTRKSVHKLRTVIRRFSSRLDLASEVVAPKAALKLRKLLARELRCLAGARDLQVQQKQLARKHPDFLDWPAYRRHLERRAGKEVQNASARLAKWGTGRQRRAFTKIVRAWTARFAGASDRRREELFRQLCAAMEVSVRSLEHQEVKLRPGDHRAFHELRLRMKDLSYKGELLPLPRSLSDRLPRLRASLGRLQDQVVFLKCARGYFHKNRKHPHPRRELERALVRRESALLGRNQEV